MTLQQIKDKVKNLGEVRAYWALRQNPWNDEEYDGTFYFGQRGRLFIDRNEVAFEAECGEVSDDAVILCYGSDVHVPLIGHFSW